MNIIRYIYLIIKQKLDSRRVQKIARLFYIFKKFDTRFRIRHKERIVQLNLSFYEFNIKKDKYRIFVEEVNSKIQIGIQKYNKNNYTWELQGIDNKLSLETTRKIFGTMLYIIKTYYSDIMYIQFKTIKRKCFNFRNYINCITSMSKSIFKNSFVSHNDKNIVSVDILPRDEDVLREAYYTKFKYKPKK